jgi:hypothetical protein
MFYSGMDTDVEVTSLAHTTLCSAVRDCYPGEPEPRRAHEASPVEIPLVRLEAVEKLSPRTK